MCKEPQEPIQEPSLGLAQTVRTNLAGWAGGRVPSVTVCFRVQNVKLTKASLFENHP